MTNEEFIKRMRENRGSLKTVEPEMECINTIGTKKLIAHALGTKLLGVRLLSEIARWPAKEQNDFVDWLDAKKRTKQDVAIYIASM